MSELPEGYFWRIQTPSESEPKLRWYLDKDRDYWRETPDGAMNLVYVSNYGEHCDSETWRGYNRGTIDELFGPLTECEAPCW